MGISVSRARYQANRIENVADSLRSLRRKLQGAEGNIHSGWKATEVNYINRTLNRLESKCSEVASKLNSLESDIVSTAYEIKREEEERERERLARLKQD
ncbi:hypothetical protein KO561_18870 [Radiobacillus kanasensis]|uniref:hypothetical protein n=1 Tax=Radiobacillus kanasensis TaxID=2844358 RepID=UPI001E32881D|nr:hypothetical protein [Radiobacillus kanasensis]UFT99213.1 hypothetical protein KO561_18870 [Radiobacillus kanasensis]